MKAKNPVGVFRSITILSSILSLKLRTSAALMAFISYMNIVLKNKLKLVGDHLLLLLLGLPNHSLQFECRFFWTIEVLHTLEKPSCQQCLPPTRQIRATFSEPPSSRGCKHGLACPLSSVQDYILPVPQQADEKIFSCVTDYWGPQDINCHERWWRQLKPILQYYVMYYFT